MTARARTPLASLLRRRWRTLLLLVAAAGGMLWLALPPPLLVETTQVTTGRLVVTIDEEGKARVRQRHLVRAGLTGELERLTLEPGDPISRGQLLATVVAPHPQLRDARREEQLAQQIGAAAAQLRTAEAEVGRARAALALATSESARLELLASQGAATRQERERAESARTGAAEALRGREQESHAARHAFEAARALQRRGSPLTAERGEVRAPCDGVVLRRLRESEGFVEAGEPLLELGDPRDLELVVEVLSTEALAIRPGALATLVGWGGPRPLAAQVARVGPAAHTRVSALGIEEQRVDVVLLPVDPLPLGDGYHVEARILVEALERVQKVPSTCLVRTGSDWSLFVVAGGRAQLRRVEVGPSNGLETAVRSGVVDGEQLILHPGDALSDGVRVRAVRAISPRAEMP